MLGRKKKPRVKKLSPKDELKQLLLPQTGRDDAGILELANQALGSDLHKNKISRIRVLVERL